MHRPKPAIPVALLFVACVLGVSTSFAETPENRRSPRTFQFVYGGRITNVPANKRAKIWIPLATSSLNQTVVRTATSLPDQFKVTRERRYGNSLIYLEKRQSIPYHFGIPHVPGSL